MFFCRNELHMHVGMVIQDEKRSPLVAWSRFQLHLDIPHSIKQAVGCPHIIIQEADVLFCGESCKLVDKFGGTGLFQVDAFHRLMVSKNVTVGFPSSSPT
jgi:hypothetical protein